LLLATGIETHNQLGRSVLAHGHLCCSSNVLVNRPAFLRSVTAYLSVLLATGPQMARPLGGFWMQTTGAALLMFIRCSPGRVRTPAQDSHSAHGLLYLAAVRDDPRQQEHCQGHVDIGPATLTAPEAVACCCLYLRRLLDETSVGPCLVHRRQTTPRCELPARATTGRSWQFASAVNGSACKRMRVPVAVLLAVSS